MLLSGRRPHGAPQPPHAARKSFELPVAICSDDSLPVNTLPARSTRASNRVLSGVQLLSLAYPIKIVLL